MSCFSWSTGVASGLSRTIFRLKAEATRVGVGVALLVIALAVTAGIPRADSGDPDHALAILPDGIVLRGQGSHQQLLVEALAGETYVGNRTANSTFTSSNPTVAAVDAKGLVTAVGDGRALITVRDGARRVSTMVEVERASAPAPLTFRNHVVPVLTRVGCNSGPCHGTLAGKSGFKLTLRGYDPEADYLTLTRQATARRINLVEPRQKPHAAQADARRVPRRR